MQSLDTTTAEPAGGAASEKTTCICPVSDDLPCKVRPMTGVAQHLDIGMF